MATVTVKDFQVGFPNDWCPGCGDFGILNSLHQALAGLGLKPHEVAVFGGIGCSGKTQYYVNAYDVHTLHGRVLPYATGAKLANPELTVVAVGGDGDGMAIGAGHFVNAGRSNLDLTYILHNNEVYGLTKGQASPTLPMGSQTKSLPEPTIQGSVNPLMLALASGYTWIGRGYAFDVRGLVELIQRAIRHKGLSFLEVLQPCPTYNNLHTKAWFAGKDQGGVPRVAPLDPSYDPVIEPDAGEGAVRARLGAFVVEATRGGEPIRTGVFLENLSVPDLGERLAQRLPAYRHAPPAHRVVADAKGRSNADLTPLFAEVAVS
ncbi:thiamine pyrophosphate-dependent enzyme [Limnochorda pilosa]|uniref:2-oxoglutarate ferredoxin oxidoreductase subunit beta n=1 Tax=Limnochorda pilosa TaxID=1555112 RepID=A0A0K2SQ54_LIMPI|nr:2-oxoglutarate ferredoxin oxidoreductase subunit beta [Limnochorda pilosa]